MVDTSNVGAGGPWKVEQEQRCSTVVTQENDFSCVSACGEMLSGGRLSQVFLISVIGAPTATEALVPHLGVGWQCGSIADESLKSLIDRGEPFGAELMPPNARPVAHLVIIDGCRADDKFVIRDPWKPGTKYFVSVSEFLLYWTGVVVFH